MKTNFICEQRFKFDLLTIFSAISFCYFVFLTVVWVFFSGTGDVPPDWHTFWDTAILYAEGSYHKLYPGITPGLPFFYPPYFPLFVFPLSFFPKSSVYIVLILLNVFLMLLTFKILKKITSIELPVILKLLVISITSASWHVMIALGHFSTLYLFLMCLGLYFQISDKRFFSGIILSMLMLKPNIGVLFLVLFYGRGDYKMLKGWFLGVGLLCLLPFLYSSSLWHDYIRITLSIGKVLQSIPPWKHHTIHALLRSVLPTGSLNLISPLWLMFAGTLTANCIYIWYKTMNVSGVLMRLFGIAVLTIVVCNPYFYHYDAIILVLPAVVFYNNRKSYFYKTTGQIITLSLFAAFVCQHLSVFYIKGGISIVSIPLVIWLISESIDLCAMKQSKEADSPF